MTVERTQQGSATILRPRGAITEETVVSLCEAVERLSPGSRLVIDLKEVPYLDSSGLEYLCDLNDRVLASSERLRLAETQDVCREIFDLTDLSKDFDFYRTVEDAVRSFL